MNKAILLFFISAALSACASVGPDYNGPPEMPLNEAWNHQLGSNYVAGDIDISQWWRSLNDPILNSLMRSGLSGNLDVRSALARIDEAEGRYGVAAADLYPAIDAVGSAQRRNTSENNTNDRETTDNFSDIGARIGWEVDVVGRIRRENAAAKAEVEASVEDLRDVMVILSAEIASTYIQTRTLQKRLQIVSDNIRYQKETLGLVTARFNAELVSAVDVSKAKQNLASSQAGEPLIRAALKKSVNHLAVLLGKLPGAVESELMIAQPLPAVPDEIIVTLPREMVRQRPDIRRAERSLAAQSERIGIATADLYPRLTLNGAFSLNTGPGGGGLFSGGSNSWSFGPNFTWSVFNAGEVRSNIAIQDARAEQARSGYEQTVLEAFEDVENSLVDFDQERVRKQFLRNSVAAAQDSAEKTRVQYRFALIDFQPVLDAQRVQLQEEDRLASSQGDELLYLISIYRSMGGGWWPDRMNPEVSAAPQSEQQKTEKSVAADAQENIELSAQTSADESIQTSAEENIEESIEDNVEEGAEQSIEQDTLESAQQVDEESLQQGLVEQAETALIK